MLLEPDMKPADQTILAGSVVALPSSASAPGPGQALVAIDAVRCEPLPNQLAIAQAIAGNTFLVIPLLKRDGDLTGDRKS